MSISRGRKLAMTLVASLCAGVSSGAFAHVDVGVNIGVPGAVYAPEPVYVQPQQVYVQPPAAVVISPGWYGERYYDGHRYWEHREWEERHRHEREWHDARNNRGPQGDWGHDHQHGEQRGHHDHENDGGRGDPR
jgi:ABC-type nickel/cobalt efflux system permease component RcnA